MSFMASSQTYTVSSGIFGCSHTPIFKCFNLNYRPLLCKADNSSAAVQRFRLGQDSNQTEQSNFASFDQQIQIEDCLMEKIKNIRNHQSKTPTGPIQFSQNLQNITEVAQENSQALKDDQKHLLVESEDSAPLKCPLIKWAQYLCSLFINQSNDVQIGESQVSLYIKKIRKKKPQIVLPPPTNQKKTLVLDLDQTLVYSTTIKPKHYDYMLKLNSPKGPIHIYLTKRFGLDAFLFEMSQLYEIVIFTATGKEYVKLALNLLDPKGRIHHRITREHCININSIYFLKDLRILGRNLNRVILVDDNKTAGMLQPQNHYLIQPFFGEAKDRKLLRLAAFLRWIEDKKKVTPIPLQRKNMIKNAFTKPCNKENKEPPGYIVCEQVSTCDTKQDTQSLQ